MSVQLLFARYFRQFISSLFHQNSYEHLDAPTIMCLSTYTGHNPKTEICPIFVNSELLWTIPVQVWLIQLEHNKLLLFIANMSRIIKKTVRCEVFVMELFSEDSYSFLF